MGAPREAPNGPVMGGGPPGVGIGAYWDQATPFQASSKHTAMAVDRPGTAKLPTKFTPQLRCSGALCPKGLSVSMSVFPSIRNNRTRIRLSARIPVITPDFPIPFQPVPPGVPASPTKPPPFRNIPRSALLPGTTYTPKGQGYESLSVFCDRIDEDTPSADGSFHLLETPFEAGGD